jgi:hypothetical protein
MGLIDVALLLFVAVAVLLVMVGDALGRVVVAGVAALARAPWHAGQWIRRHAGHETPAARPRPERA